MRFKLVEEPTKKVNVEWPPSRKTLNAYNNLDTTDKQLKFLQDKIFPHPIFKNLYGVQPIIIDCIQKFGLDPQRNLFLNFVTNLNVPMPNAKSRPKLQYIYSSHLNKKIDVRMPVLSNPTLYDRNDREFQYTVNAFHLFSDPKRYKAYLKDSEKTAQVDISQFMSGNTVKPAGLDGSPGDTIFNVIEDWAKDNEYSPQEIADRKAKIEKEKKEKEDGEKGDSNTSPKYVLEDVIPEPWEYEILKSYVESAFKHKDLIKPKSDKESYLYKLYVALEYPKLISSEFLQTVQNTSNKILNKSVDNISESDVKAFGNPTNQPDVPIPVKVIEDGTSKDGVSGVFLFHKFVALTKNHITELKQQSAKYKRDMELKTFVMANDKTIEKLKGLISVLDQIG